MVITTNKCLGEAGFLFTLYAQRCVKLYTSLFVPASSLPCVLGCLAHANDGRAGKERERWREIAPRFDTLLRGLAQRGIKLCKLVYADVN